MWVKEKICTGIWDIRRDPVWVTYRYVRNQCETVSVPLSVLSVLSFHLPKPIYVSLKASDPISLSLSSEPRACIWATQCPRFGVWLWTSEHLTFSTYHLPYLENQSNCCSHEHFSSFLLLTFISEQASWFYYMCSQLFCLLLAPMSYIYLIRLKSSVLLILLPLCCCVGLGNNYLWFEWKLFHTCSCVWTLGLLVLLFEREKVVARIRLWEFIALSWFQFTTPSQLLSNKVKMWSCSFLLLPPSTMPPPP